MKLSNREWALVLVAMTSVCLVIFLVAGTARSTNHGAVVVPPAAAAGNEEQFNLTLDERGLRSDWRAGEEAGTFRLDMDEGGLRIRARGIGPGEGTGADDPQRRRRCTCECGCHP